MGGPYREAPRTGFEPVTHRLTAGCSTVELSRKIPLPLRTMAVYTRLAISSIGFLGENSVYTKPLSIAYRIAAPRVFTPIF